MKRVAAFLLALASLGNGPAARPSVHADSARVETAAPRRLPFSVGEKLTYDAKVNFLHVGTASMTVEGIDTIRGRPAYHTVFRVHGRMLFFVVDDYYESWIDTATFSSLRFVQRIHEGGYRKQRRFEFYPEQGTMNDGEHAEVQPSVPYPLDECSFIYFVRTLRLEVGTTRRFYRYFRPSANPVQLNVLRQDSVQVPAGTFEAMVIQPIIKTQGLFAEGGHAEIWLSTDSTQKVLKMSSGLPFGTLILELRQVEQLK